MLHVLHISNKVISREIELNTFLQSFFIHMDSKRVVKYVQQIRSSDNLADLFTKALLTSTFKKLIYKNGMRQLKDIDNRGSMLMIRC